MEKAKALITNDGPESVMIAQHFTSPCAEVFYPQIILAPGEQTEIEIVDNQSITITEIEYEIMIDGGGGSISVPVGGDGQPPPADQPIYTWQEGKLIITTR